MPVHLLLEKSVGAPIWLTSSSARIVVVVEYMLLDTDDLVLYFLFEYLSLVVLLRQKFFSWTTLNRKIGGMKKPT